MGTMTKAKFAALREQIISRAVQTATSQYFGDKIDAWKAKHLTELATFTFDSALGFGFVEGKPATAIDRSSNIGGYYTPQDVNLSEAIFEQRWNAATEVLRKVTSQKIETNLVSSGGARMAIAATLVEEILDLLHMDDALAFKPENDFFA